MKRYLNLLWIMLICVAILLSGCAGGPANAYQTTEPGETKETAKNVDVEGADLLAGIKAATWSQTPEKPAEQIINGINHFAAGLFKTSATDKGNVMVSPASVFLALAMTLNGADGETKAAIIRTLTAEGLTLEDINKASRDWIALLAANTSGRTTLAIANSIWFRLSFEPDPAFLQRDADFFGASARRLDFDDSKAPDVVNDWVNRATCGTIKKIIEKISPSTMMYLINTVYFKSDWLTPFDKNETYEQNFQTPEGDVKTLFLHRTGKMSYFTGEDVKGVALPYENGKLVYFALLPDGQMKPRDWLSNQDEKVLFANISGWMAQKSNFTVNLAMPKFEASYENTLNDELTSLGMGIAFDGGAADFSLLNAQHEKGLYISEVKHKTFIRVDEKGTEASAATSVAIDESAPSYDVQLVLDRPFIYGILDLQTGIPLFVGILEDPTAK